MARTLRVILGPVAGVVLILSLLLAACQAKPTPTPAPTATSVVVVVTATPAPPGPTPTPAPTATPVRVVVTATPAPPGPTPTPAPTATPVRVVVTATPIPTVAPTPRPIKNADTFVQATIGDLESLDPAWAYDTASAEQLFNIYETLVFPKGESTSEFEPMLATAWTISPDGKEYRFTIRKGVKFHNGNDLTPSDVAYSIQRAMVQDRDGGPVWLLLEPLLGVSSTRDGDGKIVVNFADIANAVKVDGDAVVFRLKDPYPPFMAILSQSWSSIVDKEWAIQQKDWDGTEATWQKFNNPESPPLQSVTNGTGPFKLERWDPGREIALVRNDTYWRTPAKLKRVVTKVMDEWTTRKLALQAGDADWAYVPRANIGEVEGVPGVKVYKDLPGLVMTAFFFTFNVKTDSPYLGSGKLDGKGIPPDFFSDIHARLGFAYSFDWPTYIKEALLGEGSQPGSPVIKGLPFHNPNEAKYAFNKAKAEEHFKAAWGGQVWEKGFELTLLYNVGNAERKTAADMLMWNLVRLNPKFNIKVQAIAWPTLLRNITQQNLPLFFIGWLADYADPHNFVHPFMHSQVTFSGWQGYKNPKVDELIAAGIKTTDPAQRQSIYNQLQQTYYEDVVSVPLHQPLIRHYFRDWVKGWYYNPVFPGRYFYVLSKE